MYNYGRLLLRFDRICFLSFLFVTWIYFDLKYHVFWKVSNRGAISITASHKKFKW